MDERDEGEAGPRPRRDADDRRERLAKVVDRLAERFGDDVVRPASLLRPPS